MPTLKLQTNVPVEVALKYESGKDVTSQIDGKPQVMYSLTSGDQVYVSTEVAAKIDALHLAPGETFVMMKREVRQGVKRYTEIMVNRGDIAPAQSPAPRAPQAAAQMLDEREDLNPPGGDDDLTRHLAASIVHAHEQRTPAPPRQPAPVATMPVRQAAPLPTTSSAAPSLPAQVMGSALIAAYDAARMLQDYSREQGAEVRLGADQIQAIAVTFYIDLQKHGAGAKQASPPRPAHAPPAVNGGAQQYRH